MPTLTRESYHHGDLRASLIALARAALEADGPDAIALRALAKQAGVSGMAPYRHFADKASLLDAVAQEAASELYQDLRAVDDPAHPKRSLSAFAAVYVRFAVARPGLFRLIFQGRPPTPEARAQDPQTLVGLMAARIAQLVAPEDREAALLACWCLMHGLASLLVAGRIGEETPPDALAKQLTKMLIKSLTA